MAGRHVRRLLLPQGQCGLTVGCRPNAHSSKRLPPPTPLGPKASGLRGHQGWEPQGPLRSQLAAATVLNLSKSLGREGIDVSARVSAIELLCFLHLLGRRLSAGACSTRAPPSAPPSLLPAAVRAQINSPHL